MDQETKDRRKFLRSLTTSHLKDFARVSSTPEKPFRFATVTIVEAADYSWYKDMIGQEVIVYLNIYKYEDGTEEIDQYCAFRWIKKDRIEITGKFKKEHLDI